MAPPRWRPWFVPVAVVLAVAEAGLMLLGFRAPQPHLLVWLPAVAGPALAAAAFFATMGGTEGTLRTFWRRVAVGMAAVEVGALSQTVDIVTLPHDGMPPIGGRTLVLYVVAATLAITAMLRLPDGGRTWRQLVTALLEVAVVGVTAAIAASEYLDWAVDRFGGRAPAWWLNLAMTVIGVAGVSVIVKIITVNRSPVPRASLWWLAPIGLAGPLSAVLMTLLRPWPHLNGSAAVLPFVGLCGVLAAYAQQRPRPPVRMTLPPMYRRGTAVPLVATCLTSLLVAGVYLRTGHLTSVQVAGMTLLLLLVVARQAFALADNTLLLGRVAHQAMHDELTGLYSRRYFTEAAAQARRVVLVDLRDFRSINDSLGPEAGDALLVAVGARLTRLAGDRAVVARLGGDEFGLLLPSPGTFVERLLAATTEPLHAAGNEVLVEVSVGIADTYRHAEIALREATANPGRRVVHYDASLASRLTQRATIAADLRRALSAGEFHMLYQPIVELPSGRMVGVESLVRWRSAAPADFIPVAEDTGLIVELGAWIIDTVCARAAHWPELRSVAVNVSARQLLDPALPEVVAAALARHGLPAQRLTVEITETAVFGGGRALATVEALSRLGVSIALDDFGTGHSSLGLLRTCPVDAIKVDKSFIDGLNGTPQQEAIAVALTGIANTLGLRTVAEGVETAEQARRLHELGYRQAQGFHFARPLPPEAIDDMLHAGLRQAS